MPVTKLPPMPAMKEPEEAPKKARSAFTHEELTSWTHDQLLELRGDIDRLLPVRSLKHLDLEQELVLQLVTVQRMQTEVLRDQDVPANQQAQTAGQVASTLKMLSDLQERTYTSERLKKIEQILIRAVENLPREAQVEFLTAYRELGGVSQ